MIGTRLVRCPVVPCTSEAIFPLLISHENFDLVAPSIGDFWRGGLLARGDLLTALWLPCNRALAETRQLASRQLKWVPLNKKVYRFSSHDPQRLRDYESHTDSERSKQYVC